MTFHILLIAVPLLGLIAFVFAGTREKSGYSWVQFFARGKDAGFSIKEIRLLRRLAIDANLKEPTSLFWSVKQLDFCIKGLLNRARLTGQDRTKETQDFLTKLYEYRQKVEFEQPRYKNGISSTKLIDCSQPLRILVEGIGVFKSTVVRNSDRFLTITRPVGSALPSSFSWKGHRMAVYFWRQNDAGYVFDTYVLDETTTRASTVLQLAHTDSLFRAQKRRSVRAKTRISAYLYIVKEVENVEKIEVDPGLRCIIDDLSADGCAVTIGGKALSGLKVKVQFELDGEPLAISGVVRSCNYDEESNRSLLHIEAEHLSTPTRNRILAEVFNVHPDDSWGSHFEMGEGDPSPSTPSRGSEEITAADASTAREETVSDSGGNP